MKRICSVWMLSFVLAMSACSAAHSVSSEVTSEESVAMSSEQTTNVETNDNHEASEIHENNEIPESMQEPVTTELPVVSEIEEDVQNPLADYEGIYQSDRARADIQAMSDGGGFIIIEWANGADSLARWTIYGILDPETLTIHYDGCIKENVTYNEDGSTKEETTEYDNGTGYILFNSDSLGFVWQEDQSDSGIASFEWVKGLED